MASLPALTDTQEWLFLRNTTASRVTLAIHGYAPPIDVWPLPVDRVLVNVIEPCTAMARVLEAMEWPVELLPEERQALNLLQDVLERALEDGVAPGGWARAAISAGLPARAASVMAEIYWAAGGGGVLDGDAGLAVATMSQVLLLVGSNMHEAPDATDELEVESLVAAIAASGEALADAPDDAAASAASVSLNACLRVAARLVSARAPASVKARMLQQLQSSSAMSACCRALLDASSRLSPLVCASLQFAALTTLACVAKAHVDAPASSTAAAVDVLAAPAVVRFRDACLEQLARLDGEGPPAPEAWAVLRRSEVAPGEPHLPSHGLACRLLADVALCSPDARLPLPLNERLFPSAHAAVELLCRASTGVSQALHAADVPPSADVVPEYRAALWYFALAAVALLPRSPAGVAAVLDVVAAYVAATAERAGSAPMHVAAGCFSLLRMAFALGLDVAPDTCFISSPHVYLAAATRGLPLGCARRLIVGGLLRNLDVVLRGALASARLSEAGAPDDAVAAIVKDAAVAAVVLLPPLLWSPPVMEALPSGLSDVLGREMGMIVTVAKLALLLSAAPSPSSRSTLCAAVAVVLNAVGGASLSRMVLAASGSAEGQLAPALSVALADAIALCGRAALYVQCSPVAVDPGAPDAGRTIAGVTCAWTSVHPPGTWGTLVVGGAAVGDVPKHLAERMDIAEETILGGGGAADAAAAARVLAGVTSGRRSTFRICGNLACGSFSGKHETLLALKVCGQCKSVRYCGAACQAVAWAQHKAECVALAAMYANDS